MLSRNEEKHIMCTYTGHEDNCPKSCSRCAFRILENGDDALAQGKLKEAMQLYKKAAFIEPKYADAWVRIGKVYGLLCEHNNSLSAFNKAIAIDPQYGDALFQKANTLVQLDRLEEAMTILNELIDLGNADCVYQLKSQLMKRGVKDEANEVSLQNAVELMTEQAYATIKNAGLLNAQGKVSTEKAIYVKEEFAARTAKLCKKTFQAYGEDKVQSESMLTAFYGSICTTLFYYSDPDSFKTIFPFDYLLSRVDIEKTEEAAERLLGILSNEAASDALWNVIYPFVQYSKSVICRIDNGADKEPALLDAVESAYVMGMLFAMRHSEREQEKRASLDKALKKLADSTKDYNYTPTKRRAMCYSIEMPERGPVYFNCEICGKMETIEFDKGNGNEQQAFDSNIEKYRALALKFSKLGYPSEVKIICTECANQKYPSLSRYLTNNLVFSLTRKDCGKTIISYPSLTWFEETPYRIALAFLNGADTMQKLSEATGTKLSAEDYLKHIHNVLGDASKNIR